LILRDKVLTPEQLEKILDPFEMTSPGIAGTDKKQDKVVGGADGELVRSDPF